MSEKWKSRIEENSQKSEKNSELPLMLEALDDVAKTRQPILSIERDIFLDVLGEYIPMSKVLVEPGSGDGALARIISGSGYDLIEIDKSRLALSRKNAQFPRSRSLLRGDLLKLPFSDNSVDNAISLIVYHVFQEDDLEKALSEIYRVLKIGGMFVHFQDAGPNRWAIMSDFLKKGILPFPKFTARGLPATSFFLIEEGRIGDLVRYLKNRENKELETFMKRYVDDPIESCFGLSNPELSDLALSFADFFSDSKIARKFGIQTSPSTDELFSKKFTDVARRVGFTVIEWGKRSKTKDIKPEKFHEQHPQFNLFDYDSSTGLKMSIMPAEGKDSPSYGYVRLRAAIRTIVIRK